MTKPWISDGKQRASKRYMAVLDDLRGIAPATHLKALVALPTFSISYSDDLDKRQRHLLHSREWKEGKL